MTLFILAVLALVVVSVYWKLNSGNSRPRSLPGARQNPELAQRRWIAVKRVAEEDVTQLGQQIAETPVPASLDAEPARDFESALGAYETAKELIALAEHPDDLQWVSRSIDDGRFALATLAARREDRALPVRRPPCFFDQRHGLSVADVPWAPAGGVVRDVPACPACQAQIADGRDPAVRQVPTDQGDRPYYDAGAEYGPWARGWYSASGAYVLSNVMFGTMLMNAAFMPIGYDYLATESGADGSEGSGDGGNNSGGDDPGLSDGGGDVGGDWGGGFGDMGF